MCIYSCLHAHTLVAGCATGLLPEHRHCTPSAHCTNANHVFMSATAYHVVFSMSFTISSHCFSAGDVWHCVHFIGLLFSASLCFKSTVVHWVQPLPGVRCLALAIAESRSMFQPNVGPMICVVYPSLQITSGYCPKTWEVSNSLTKTTAGNFCAGKKYSSMYSCAANCRYSSSQLEQAQCAGLPDKLSYTSGEQAVAVCQKQHVRNSHYLMLVVDGLMTD